MKPLLSTSKPEMNWRLPTTRILKFLCRFCGVEILLDMRRNQLLAGLLLQRMNLKYLSNIQLLLNISKNVIKNLRGKFVKGETKELIG